jgi:hypothetical protein
MRTPAARLGACAADVPSGAENAPHQRRWKECERRLKDALFGLRVRVNDVAGLLIGRREHSWFLTQKLMRA